MIQLIKHKLILAMLALNIVSAIAQNNSILPKQQDGGSILEKLYFGGNFGLQFGTITYIDVSPLVGYRITERISAGVGITYQYYHYKDKSYNFSTNVFGGRVFGRYLFTEHLLGHAEYEYLNLEAFDLYPRRRVGVESLLAGGGYIQSFGTNSSFVALLLYNFTPSVYTPYSNPVIRVGVNFGF